MVRERFLLSLVFMTFMAPIVYAQVSVAGPDEINKYETAIAKADVVHLGGAVIAEKNPGYQVKWNSQELSPGLPEGAYGGDTLSSARHLIGGVNNGQQQMHVAALIPFFEYRDNPNPEKEIMTVLVNGRPADSFVFLPGKDVGSAIEMAHQSIPESKLFSTQLDPRAPTLFIDAGILAPGESVKIEYETRARNYRVN